MTRTLSALAAPAVLAALAAMGGAAPASAGEAARTFTFRYEAVVEGLPADAGPVHVWVPLAAADGTQRVRGERVEASIPGAVEREPVYGNRFWHGRAERVGEAPLRVVVETRVERAVRRRAVPARSAGLPPGERDAYRLFLGPNARVPVDHPILEPIRAEVRAAADGRDPAALARAIYDWVVDNVEYKKVGTGWGNGDTFWACSQRYGNCTDFHALFISLARSEGIPARFEIGFPVPEDRAEASVGGYHCWVQLYLPESGWIPIDASEAAKHPDRRGLFFGTHPADRIHFSTGRDLRLGPDHRGPPLNYFVYPHVEVDGAPWPGRVETRFSFREEAPGPGPATAVPAR